MWEVRDGCGRLQSRGVGVTVEVSFGSPASLAICPTLLHNFTSEPILLTLPNLISPLTPL